MPQSNETQLKAVCAAQAAEPDTLATYADLIANIGQSANAVVKTCLIAIQLYHDAKGFFDTLSNNSRALPPNKAVAAVQAAMRELSE